MFKVNFNKLQSQSSIAQADNCVVVKAIFEQEKLLAALSAVSAAQSEIEMGWVQVIFTDENQVIFSSSSPSIWIKYQLETNFQGQGFFKVNGRQFFDYVKQLPPSKIYLDAFLPEFIKIKCDGSSAKIQLIQDQTISQVVPSSPGTCIVATGEVLSRWMVCFKDFIMVDEVRFYANGALIWVEVDKDKNKLFAVASDSLRLAKVSIEEGIDVKSIDSSRVLVPKRAIDELSRIIALNQNEKFTLKWSEKELSFSVESKGYLMSAKCIAGIYPPYENAIPQIANVAVSVNLKKIQDSVRRALIFADKNKVIALSCQDNILKLESRTDGFKEGEEVIQMDNTLEFPFEVKYNGHLLFGILSVLSGAKVSFVFENPTRAVKMIGEDQKSIESIYLLVPARM